MYGIYANIGDILMVNVTIYSSTMDPMGKKSTEQIWVSICPAECRHFADCPGCGRGFP